MDNLRHWTRFEDIDPKFTKQITGKAYKGTSPNPQYVIKCLTEIFGPVGEGFGWEVIAEDFIPLGEEVLHWCRICFWHTDRANTFQAYGQTKALMKTRNGLILDEDAPKKSLTDAIVKAASHVGIAANIFLGRWDDQRHVDAVNEEYRAEERQQQPSGEEEPSPKASPAAVAELKAKLLRNVDNNQHPGFQVDLKSLREMDAEAASEVDDKIKSRARKAAA